jgi:hypothetical protein
MSKIKKRCETCNKEFECWISAAARRKTCSQECKKIQPKTPHRCIDCGETDPIKFYGGKKITCKKCHNEMMMLKRRNMLKEGRKLLGGKCSTCGYNKCDAALEFHHISDNKEFVIAGAKYGWEKLKPEIEKCILLCANCHREVHN